MTALRSPTGFSATVAYSHLPSRTGPRNPTPQALRFAQRTTELRAGVLPMPKHFGSPQAKHRGQARLSSCRTPIGQYRQSLGSTRGSSRLPETRHHRRRTRAAIRAPVPSYPDSPQNCQAHRPTAHHRPNFRVFAPDESPPAPARHTLPRHSPRQRRRSARTGRDGRARPRGPPSGARITGQY